MPSLLPPRPSARRDADGSIRIDPATLAAAQAIGCGGRDTGHHHLDVLVRSGLVELVGEDEHAVLDPAFAALIALVAGAPVAVLVQRFEGLGSTTASVLLGPTDAALVEHNADGTCTVRAIAATGAAVAVARLVGFEVDRPEAPPLPVRAADAVGRFHACLMAGDGPGASAALGRAHQLSSAELGIVLDLLDGRCRSWRVLNQQASLTVIDGGPRGLLSVGGGAGGAPTGFRPSSPTAVAARLATLLAPPAAGQRAA